MDAALAHDGAGEGQASTNPLLAPLFDSAQSEDKKLVNISMQLGTNLVALGASATTHYPPLSKLLGVEVAVPEHADVAGAVGAAIGSVRQRVMISISQPSEGKFRVPSFLTDRLTLPNVIRHWTRRVIPPAVWPPPEPKMRVQDILM